MSNGDVVVGLVEAVDGRNGTQGYMRGIEAAYGQINGVKRRQAVAGGSTAIQIDVLYGDSADRVQELLDPSRAT